MVDSDQQYLHLNQVVGLHKTLYSRPFVLPTTVPTSQQKNSIEGDTDMTFDTLDSTMVSSEMTSEVSVDYDQVKVGFPLVLPSSQLRCYPLLYIPYPFPYHTYFRKIGLRCPLSTIQNPFILDENKYSIFFYHLTTEQSKS